MTEPTRDQPEGCWACLQVHAADVSCAPRPRRLRRVVFGFVLAVVLPLTVSVAAPAEAATPLPASNWLRSCSTTKSHPVSSSCTVEPRIVDYRLTYRDAGGQLIVLSRPGAVWAWAKAHSRSCSLKAGHVVQFACYWKDPVTKRKVIVYQSMTTVAVTAMGR